MNIQNKFTYKHTSKKYDVGDFVDRTSYISDEDQYERLMMAGITREQFLSEKNAYATEDALKALYDDRIREFIGSSLYQNPHYSKQELHDILEVKSAKVKQAIKSDETIKKHYKDFLAEYEHKKYEDQVRTNVIKDLVDKGLITKDFKVNINKTDS